MKFKKRSSNKPCFIPTEKSKRLLSISEALAIVTYETLHLPIIHQKVQSIKDTYAHILKDDMINSQGKIRVINHWIEVVPEEWNLEVTSKVEKKSKKLIQKDKKENIGKESGSLKKKKKVIIQQKEPTENKDSSGTENFLTKCEKQIEKDIKRPEKHICPLDYINMLEHQDKRLRIEEISESDKYSQQKDVHSAEKKEPSISQLLADNSVINASQDQNMQFLRSFDWSQDIENDDLGEVMRFDNEASEQEIFHEILETRKISVDTIPLLQSGQDDEEARNAILIHEGNSNSSREDFESVFRDTPSRGTLKTIDEKTSEIPKQQLLHGNKGNYEEARESDDVEDLANALASNLGLETFYEKLNLDKIERESLQRTEFNFHEIKAEVLNQEEVNASWKTQNECFEEQSKTRYLDNGIFLESFKSPPNLESEHKDVSGQDQKEGYLKEVSAHEKQEQLETEEFDNPIFVEISNTSENLEPQIKEREPLLYEVPGEEQSPMQESTDNDLDDEDQKEGYLGEVSTREKQEHFETGKFDNRVSVDNFNTPENLEPEAKEREPVAYEVHVEEKSTMLESTENDLDDDDQKKGYLGEVPAREKQEQFETRESENRVFVENLEPEVKERELVPYEIHVEEQSSMQESADKNIDDEDQKQEYLEEFSAETGEFDNRISVDNFNTSENLETKVKEKKPISYEVEQILFPKTEQSLQKPESENDSDLASQTIHLWQNNEISLQLNTGSSEDIEGNEEINEYPERDLICEENLRKNEIREKNDFGLIQQVFAERDPYQKQEISARSKTDKIVDPSEIQENATVAGSNFLDNHGIVIRFCSFYSEIKNATFLSTLEKSDTETRANTFASLHQTEEFNAQERAEGNQLLITKIKVSRKESSICPDVEVLEKATHFQNSSEQEDTQKKSQDYELFTESEKTDLNHPRSLIFEPKNRTVLHSSVSQKFEFTHDAEQAYIAGTFSNWEKIEMTRLEGQSHFEVSIDLEVDRIYHYRFFVNGRPITDPTKPVDLSEDLFGFNIIRIHPNQLEESLSLLKADNKVYICPSNIFFPSVPIDYKTKHEDNTSISLIRLQKHVHEIQDAIEHELEMRRVAMLIDAEVRVSPAPTGKSKKRGQKKRKYEAKLLEHEISITSGGLAVRKKNLRRFENLCKLWKKVLSSFNPVNFEIVFPPMELVNGQTQIPSLISPTKDTTQEAVNMNYTQAFLHERPKEAFDAIQTRLRKAKTLNEELAEYFRERASVEDNYVKSLQKLTRKNFLSEKSSLGAFSAIWEPLFQELAEISNTHSLFVSKILEEVEGPIREKATSEEWLQLKNCDTTMNKIVKDYEDRLQKVNKHKKQSEKLTAGKKLEASEIKLKEAQKALEQTQNEWSQEAPRILEKYQSVDELRLINLKESIARFETMQVETCQKRVAMAERTLELVFTFDVPSEIENFCLQRMHSLEGSFVDESSLNLGYVSPSSSWLQPTSRNTHKTSVPNNSFDIINTRSDVTDLVNEDSNISTKLDDQFEHSPPSESTLPKVRVDDEGYTIPPADVKPWDLFGYNPSVDDDSDSRSEATRIRLEIKEESIPENNKEEAATAINQVRNTLQSRSTLNTGRRTFRGRRESQYRRTVVPTNENNIFTDSPLDNRLSPNEIGSSSTSSPTSFEFSEANHQKSSSNSSEVRSQGLRASISENLNIIVKGGEVSKLFVTGEITIISNHTTTQPIRIKIANFGTLEKAAPNASYLQEVTGGESGQYDINTEMLSLTNGISVIVMKYQVHIDPEHKTSFLPIQVFPQWKCEPNQTSLVIFYQPNPESKLTGTLSDLSFLIPVDGEVGTVQSNPTGVWNGEKQKIFWQVGDLDISSPERKRLVARFETRHVSNPAPAAIKFLCKGQLLSNISLEVVSQPRSHEVCETPQQRQDDLIEFDEVTYQVATGRFFASA
ncbi:hypothetical protein G9A89_023367 [Geosiphon pyriformis]|nr:hypothetical protein G9A89_023367 [Geosiphon pyriformis]